MWSAHIEIYIWPVFCRLCQFSGLLMLHMLRTRLSYYPSTLLMYSELGLGSLQVSAVGYFETIFGSFTCCLLSEGVFILHATGCFTLNPTSYMLTGFCNPFLIFIHNNYSLKLNVRCVTLYITLLLLLLSSLLLLLFLWQYYEFLFIPRI